MLKTQRYNLTQGEVLLIKGPSAIKAKSKGLSVLGIPVKPGEKVVIRKNKVLPFDVESIVQVILILGKGSRSYISSEKVGIRIWNHVKETILNDISSSKKKLMIIGETDSGKSTLATYLINMALQKDMKVCIVDGDIGQGDLAPPGCIGAAMIERYVYDLRDVNPDLFEFLGYISPRFIRDIVIEKIKKIISNVEEKNWNLCIINTDGYIANEGMDYKLEMVERINPNMIVCFKDVDKMLFKRLRDDVGHPLVISADKPDSVTKTSYERSGRRLNQYLRFLKGGRDLNVNLNKVKLNFMGDVYRHNLSNSELREVAQNFSSKMLGAKRADEKLIIFKYGSEDMIEMFGRYVIFNLSSLKRMFVGLGSDDDLLGFAQIKRIRSDLITLNTPLKSDFDTIFLSTIKVQNLSEVILPIVKS